MATIVEFNSPNLSVSAEELRSFCERHHIIMLALFGSVIHDDLTESSDIDVLVEFDPAHIPGFEFFAVQEELGELLGREVDLNTLGFLSRHIQATVRKEAVVLYEKA